MIIDAVNHIDVSKYKESMSPLIKKDIDELMKVFYRIYSRRVCMESNRCRGIYVY